MHGSQAGLLEDTASALLFAAWSLLGCVCLAAAQRYFQAVRLPPIAVLRRCSFSSVFWRVTEELRLAAIGLAQIRVSPGSWKWGVLVGYVTGVCLLRWLPLWPADTALQGQGLGSTSDLADDLFVLWCLLSLIGICRRVGDDGRSPSVLVWTVVPPWVLCLAFMELSQTAGTTSVAGLVAFQVSSGLWLGMTQPIAGICCIAALVVMMTAGGGAKGSLVSHRSVTTVFETYSMLHIVVLSYTLALLLLGGWHLWGIDWDRGPYGIWLTMLGCAILHIKVVCVGWVLVGIRSRWERAERSAVGSQAMFADVTCRALPVIALCSVVLTGALSRWPRLAGQTLLRATIGWLALTVVLAGVAAFRTRRRKSSEELSF
ncbi:MAG: hypothetical protein ABGZ17_04550 [Planctomycetaceae bacterium]